MEYMPIHTVHNSFKLHKINWHVIYCGAKNKIKLSEHSWGVTIVNL